jgi:hypothetical protein
MDTRSIENIRENFDSLDISKTLAWRANEMFQRIRITEENLTIVEFLEKYYGK